MCSVCKHVHAHGAVQIEGVGGQMGAGACLWCLCAWENLCGLDVGWVFGCISEPLIMQIHA